MRTIRLALLVGLVPWCLIVLTTSRTRGEMSGDRGRPIVMQGACRERTVRIAAGSASRSSASASCSTRCRADTSWRVSAWRISARRPCRCLSIAIASRWSSAPEPVPAVLNLQSGDSPFWDGLSADMRQILGVSAGRQGRPCAECRRLAGNRLRLRAVSRAIA